MYTMPDQIIAVLREGFEGPGQSLSYFLDGPGTGLRATLAALSAEEASRDRGGNSVAAHANHILFSFAAFGAYIAGDRTQRDWSESWSVSTVDETAWTKLQSDLSRSYEDLLTTIEANPRKGGDRGAVAAATHLAYHVGAIRQKLAASRR